MTSKKLLLTLGGLVILTLLLMGVSRLYPYIKGFLPLLEPGPDVSTLIGTPDSPFKLPEGFSIAIFAKNVPGARVLARDSKGLFWISQPSRGAVSRIEADGTPVTMFQGLDEPHGLAFDPDDPDVLYIAEEGKVSRVNVEATPTRFEKIVDLPSGGGHSSRTIAFGPEDGRLYVSIVSSCNVCHEENPHRAAILSMKKDGSDVKIFAKGLRNTVFFTWSYVDGRMWGTDMGRDLLGDDVPPEEINMIKEGGNYGWPICYGNNIHDTNFDKNTYIRNPCMEPFETPQQVEMQAHSAPLGLGFVPEEGWPEDMWYDLIVAFHGSWNRTVPTGYKLVRIKLDARGNFQGQEDFISGWLQGNSALGRPVDVLIQSGGTMYASDGKAGVIYKINYRGL